MYRYIFDDFNFILAGIRPVYSQKCTDILSLMGHLEGCNKELTQVKEQALLGQLNNGNKDKICR